MIFDTRKVRSKRRPSHNNNLFWVVVVHVFCCWISVAVSVGVAPAAAAAVVASSSSTTTTRTRTTTTRTALAFHHTQQQHKRHNGRHSNGRQQREQPLFVPEQQRQQRQRSLLRLPLDSSKRTDQDDNGDEKKKRGESVVLVDKKNNNNDDGDAGVVDDMNFPAWVNALRQWPLRPLSGVEKKDKSIDAAAVNTELRPETFDMDINSNGKNVNDPIMMEQFFQNRNEKEEEEPTSSSSSSFLSDLFNLEALLMTVAAATPQQEQFGTTSTFKTTTTTNSKIGAYLPPTMDISDTDDDDDDTENDATESETESGQLSSSSSSLSMIASLLNAAGAAAAGLTFNLTVLDELSELDKWVVALQQSVSGLIPTTSSSGTAPATNTFEISPVEETTLKQQDGAAVTSDTAAVILFSPLDNATSSDDINAGKSTTTDERTAESILKQATAQIEFVTLQSQRLVSPSRIASLIRQARRVIDDSTLTSVFQQTAADLALQRGVSNITQAQSQAQEFAVNLTNVADSVLVKGYVEQQQSQEQDKKKEEQSPPSPPKDKYSAATAAATKPKEKERKSSRALFADFVTATELRDDDILLSSSSASNQYNYWDMLQRSSAMGALAAAIYEETVPRTQALDHAIVAMGCTLNVRWMVTDSIMTTATTMTENDGGDCSSSSSPETPTMVRTITIRGFDASDAEVDREVLLNDVCSATPEAIKLFRQTTADNNNKRNDATTTTATPGNNVASFLFSNNNNAERSSDSTTKSNGIIEKSLNLRENRNGGGSDSNSNSNNKNNDDNNMVLVHSGLTKIARGIYKDVKQYIDWMPPSHKLIINGHSIGGSLSILFLFLLTLDRGNDFVRDRVWKVYSFGSPPVARLVFPSPPPSLKDNVDEDEMIRRKQNCEILDAFNLPTDLVHCYIQPWDPIVRLFSEIDALYPLMGDLGADGVTPFAGGPPRTLRPITKAIFEAWSGWPRFRDGYKSGGSQSYRSVGVQHILVPEPTRYLADRFVAVTIPAPPVEAIVRISSNELLDALRVAFPLDEFRISFVPEAIRSFVHHFYPAYWYPLVDYVKRLEDRQEQVLQQQQQKQSSFLPPDENEDADEVASSLAREDERLKEAEADSRRTWRVIDTRRWHANK